jgi:superfamily II DNA/RNA helicase
MAATRKPLTFEEFQPKLSENTLNVIKELGFVYLTPVQASTIPLFLQHKVDF